MKNQDWLIEGDPAQFTDKELKARDIALNTLKRTVTPYRIKDEHNLTDYQKTVFEKYFNQLNRLNTTALEILHKLGV